MKPELLWFSMAQVQQGYERQTLWVALQVKILSFLVSLLRFSGRIPEVEVNASCVY